MHVRPPSARARSTVLLIALIALVAACEGGAAGTPSTPPADGVAQAPSEPVPSLAAADPASVEAVADAIAATSLSDPATIDALGARRFDEGAPDAAARALADGATGDARWAATWVYASSGVDPAVLRPLLEDQDPSIRAIAASALVTWGEAAAIPVLVALTGDGSILAGSMPPATISQHATGTLARFVDPTMTVSAADPATAKQAWEAWLSVHDGAMAFDPATGTWSPR